MSTRSKKNKLAAVLPPPKKALKAKKKPVVVVEETRAVSPVLSQSDLARKKLAVLMAAGEVSEAKRLKEVAAFEAAAKDLEDCVMKETEAIKLKGTKLKERDERKKRSHSRSRSRSSERRRSRSPKRKSRSRSRSTNLVRRSVVPGHLFIARSPQRLVVVMVAATARLTKTAAIARLMDMEIVAR